MLTGVARLKVKRQSSITHCNKTQFKKRHKNQQSNTTSNNNDNITKLHSNQIINHTHTYFNILCIQYSFDSFYQRKLNRLKRGSLPLCIQHYIYCFFFLIIHTHTHTRNYFQYACNITFHLWQHTILMRERLQPLLTRNPSTDINLGCKQFLNQFYWQSDYSKLEIRCCGHFLQESHKLWRGWGEGGRVAGEKPQSVFRVCMVSGSILKAMDKGRPPTREVPKQTLDQVIPLR